MDFLPDGGQYLAAVVDLLSRRVLSGRLSISMDVSFCIEAVEEALSRYGRPEIFNADQGSQFTSMAFTKVLRDNEIAISMDGRGSAAANSSNSPKVCAGKGTAILCWVASASADYPLFERPLDKNPHHCQA